MATKPENRTPGNPAKKAYTPPTIAVYGSIVELTKGTGITGNDTSQLQQPD